MQTNLFPVLSHPAVALVVGPLAGGPFSATSKFPVAPAVPVAPATPAAPAMQTPLADPAAHVGRSWEAREGRRTVTRYHEPQGTFTEGAFEVMTEGHRFQELVEPSRLERRVFVETSNYAAFLRQQQQEREQQAAEKTEEARYQGFFAPMAQLRVGKARAALELVASFNGLAQRRKDFILEAVAQGAVPGETRHGRVLLLPGGGYFTARQLTQTALDFAAHLIGLRTAG